MKQEKDNLITEFAAYRSTAIPRDVTQRNYELSKQRVAGSKSKDKNTRRDITLERIKANVFNHNDPTGEPQKFETMLIGQQHKILDYTLPSKMVNDQSQKSLNTSLMKSKISKQLYESSIENGNRSQRINGEDRGQYEQRQELDNNTSSGQISPYQDKGSKSIKRKHQELQEQNVVTSNYISRTQSRRDDGLTLPDQNKSKMHQKNALGGGTQSGEGSRGELLPSIPLPDKPLKNVLQDESIQLMNKRKDYVQSQMLPSVNKQSLDNQQSHHANLERQNNEISAGIDQILNPKNKNVSLNQIPIRRNLIAKKNQPFQIKMTQQNPSQQLFLNDDTLVVDSRKSKQDLLNIAQQVSTIQGISCSKQDQIGRAGSEAQLLGIVEQNKIKHSSLFRGPSTSTLLDSIISKTNQQQKQSQHQNMNIKTQMQTLDTSLGDALATSDNARSSQLAKLNIDKLDPNHQFRSVHQPQQLYNQQDPTTKSAKHLARNSHLSQLNKLTQQRPMAKNHSRTLQKRTVEEDAFHIIGSKPLQNRENRMNKINRIQSLTAVTNTNPQSSRRLQSTERYNNAGDSSNRLLNLTNPYHSINAPLQVDYTVQGEDVGRGAQKAHSNTRLIPLKLKPTLSSNDQWQPRRINLMNLAAAKKIRPPLEAQRIDDQVRQGLMNTNATRIVRRDQQVIQPRYGGQMSPAKLYQDNQQSMVNNAYYQPGDLHATYQQQLKISSLQATRLVQVDHHQNSLKYQPNRPLNRDYLKPKLQRNSIEKASGASRDSRQHDDTANLEESAGQGQPSQQLVVIGKVDAGLSKNQHSSVGSMHTDDITHLL